MLRVDDLGEPPATHLLLQHPHVHLVLEGAQPRRIAASDLGDGRAPAWAEQSRRQRAPRLLAPGSPVHHSSLGVLVKLGRLAPGTGVRWGGRGPRCGRRGDPGGHAAGAHQLPEPTTQTFLPPMVRGAGALRGAEPAAGISRPPPGQGRPRPAPGPASPPGEPGTRAPGGQSRRWQLGGGCAAGANRSLGARAE